MSSTLPPAVAGGHPWSPWHPARRRATLDGVTQHHPEPDAGPARRAELLAAGRNIAPGDYTAEEYAELVRQGERIAALSADDFTPLDEEPPSHEDQVRRLIVEGMTDAEAELHLHNVGRVGSCGFRGGIRGHWTDEDDALIHADTLERQAAAEPRRHGRADPGE